MVRLLWRNRVRDFAARKVGFDSETGVAEEAVLILDLLLKSLEEPNNVFFVFRVRDIAEAKAFMERPESEEAGRASGVIDGEYHFVETVAWLPAAMMFRDDSTSLV